LASIPIRLQTSRSLALPLHSSVPIFLRSVDTSSSHLVFGLPLRLATYSKNNFFHSLKITYDVSKGIVFPQVPLEIQCVHSVVYVFKTMGKVLSFTSDALHVAPLQRYSKVYLNLATFD
jgi:hypothetical protein